MNTKAFPPELLHSSGINKINKNFSSMVGEMKHFKVYISKQKQKNSIVKPINKNFSSMVGEMKHFKVYISKQKQSTKNPYKMETKNTTRPMWSENEIAFSFGVIKVISKKEFGREFNQEELCLAYIVAETLAVVNNKSLIEGMFDYARMLEHKNMLALHIKMASEINDDNLDDIALQIKTALLGCEVALRLKYR